MLYFKTRTLARNFAKSSNRTIKDLGNNSLIGKRWAVVV